MPDNGRGNGDWKILLLVMAFVIGFVIFVESKYPSMIERRQAANKVLEQARQIKHDPEAEVIVILPDGSRSRLDLKPFLKSEQ